MRYIDSAYRQATMLMMAGTMALLSACGGSTSGQDAGGKASTPAMSFAFEQAGPAPDGLPDGFAWHDRTPTATATLSPDAHGGKSSLRIDNATSGAAASVSLFIPSRYWSAGSVVRVSGWLRTRDVKGGDNALPGVATFLLRADGAERVSADGDAAAQRPRALASTNMFDRGPTGTNGWKKYELMLRVPAGTRRVLFGVGLLGTGSAWVDDVELSTDATLAPASSAALAYGNEVLDLMQARAYHAASVDWKALRAELPQALAGTQTPDDVREALRPIVKRAEPHSDLLTREESAALLGEAGEQDRLPALELSRAQRFDGRLGYLTVPAYVGTDAARMTRYTDAVQDALRELDAGGVCGYVVDLRGNTGGNMGPMIAGVGPLLGTDEPGGFASRKDASYGQWFYRGGKAYVVQGSEKSPDMAASRPLALRSAAAPVAVLIGGRTASSGEAVLVTFLGRPATRFFGQPSEGLTTGNELIRLSDGAYLNLTVSAMVDRTGKIHDGPIVPDELIPATDEGGDPDKDPVARRATAWLAGQAACHR